jgi:FkbM family methyltransferase
LFFSGEQKMFAWREHSKSVLNGVAGLIGARLVGAGWGPRGFVNTLKRAKSAGLAPLTVVDVGASNGQWTQECRRIFPEAHYLLVDPLDENQEALRTLAARERGVSVWQGALGAASGQMEFQCHGDQSSFLRSDEFVGTAKTVEVRTMDQLVSASGLPSPLLIKADVQGYELEVLKGAKDSLASAELLLLEVSMRRYYDNSPLAHEVIAFAGQCGFRIYDICTYIQRPADRELIQADIAFVRADSQLFTHEGWH